MKTIITALVLLPLLICACSPSAQPSVSPVSTATVSAARLPTVTRAPAPLPTATSASAEAAAATSAPPPARWLAPAAGGALWLMGVDGSVEMLAETLPEPDGRIHIGHQPGAWNTQVFFWSPDGAFLVVLSGPHAWVVDTR